MFDLDPLPFRVTQTEGLSEAGDAILLRFHFLSPLPSGNTGRLTELIDEWLLNIPDELFLESIFDRFRFKKGRQVSTWLYFDTSGNDPALAPYLSDLFRRIHDFAPLELVEISDDYVN